MREYCNKCKVRIRAHRWILDSGVYCSPGCHRGGKTQFDKLYRVLAKMHKSYN
jgi:hypothetical protein